MEKILFTIVLLILLCFLVSCGEKGDEYLNPLYSLQETEFSSPYNVTVDKGRELGDIKLIPKNTTDEGVEYLISVVPKTGYEVDYLTVGDENYFLSDNKINCVLNTDSSLRVYYRRKNSEELEKRRDTVIEKMLQYTTTLFKYDKDYSYELNGKTIVLKAGVLYGGLPYTAYAFTSPDAFLDFALSRDGDGVYNMSFPYGDAPFYWGGSCGNAAFWAWGAVSSSIKFSYSADMIEEDGAIPVGAWAFDVEKDIINGVWNDTQNICQENGMDIMSEAYALMARGDAVTYKSPNGNHVMVVSEVNVVKSITGQIMPKKSYVICMDQNGGYGNKQTSDGITYVSSCSSNVKMSFEELFSVGYLPVTCIELLDDGMPLADIEFKDSVTKDTINYIEVTGGYIDSNYAISKVEMKITDSEGNIVYVGTRHTEEDRPQRFPFKSFSTNDLTYMKGVYKDALKAESFSAGEYRVVATAFFSNGESAVVRDKTFKK